MSILSGLVARIDKPGLGPLDGYTEAERRALVQGRGLPRPRRAIVRPDAASPVVEGRTGVSNEAVELFDRAQRAGGSLALSELRRWVRVENLRDLVDELVAFGLVENSRTSVTVAAAFEQHVLVSGGWSRWS